MIGKVRMMHAMPICAGDISFIYSNPHDILLCLPAHSRESDRNNPSDLHSPSFRNINTTTYELGEPLGGIQHANVLGHNQSHGDRNKHDLFNQ